MERIEAFRSFFASLVTVGTGLGDGKVTAAFAVIPRERFEGPGPWKVFTRAGYLRTPSDDPAFLYQDITVALADDRQINNGQPTLHAACLVTLDVKAGETIVHIGAWDRLLHGLACEPCRSYGVGSRLRDRRGSRRPGEEEPGGPSPCFGLPSVWFSWRIARLRHRLCERWGDRPA